jgi:hypothetical protein
MQFWAGAFSVAQLADIDDNDLVHGSEGRPATFPPRAGPRVNENE